LGASVATSYVSVKRENYLCRRIWFKVRGLKPTPSSFCFVRVRKKRVGAIMKLRAVEKQEHPHRFQNHRSVDTNQTCIQTKKLYSLPTLPISSTTLSFRLENALKTVGNEIYKSLNGRKVSRDFNLFLHSPPFLLPASCLLPPSLSSNLNLIPFLSLCPVDDENSNEKNCGNIAFLSKNCDKKDCFLFACA